ncbi:MAG: hypothetical protein ABJP48_03755 [Erythrobacter sp.]
MEEFLRPEIVSGMAPEFVIAAIAAACVLSWILGELHGAARCRKYFEAVHRENAQRARRLRMTPLPDEVSADAFSARARSREPIDKDGDTDSVFAFEELGSGRLSQFARVQKELNKTAMMMSDRAPAMPTRMDQLSDASSSSTRE